MVIPRLKGRKAARQIDQHHAPAFLEKLVHERLPQPAGAAGNHGYAAHSPAALRHSSKVSALVSSGV